MKQIRWDVKKVMMSIGVAAVAVALVAMFVIGQGSVASGEKDYLSLSGIEEIKSQVTAENPYNILEIVPEAGSGSIGYYIPGEEPFDWKPNLMEKETPQERMDYMTALLTELEGEGILGADESTPLTKKGGYRESYPWETNRGEGYEELVYEEKIEEELELVFSYQGAGAGDFSQIEATYELVAEGETGEYKQIIEHVENSDKGSYETFGYYYYNMEFSKQLWLDGTAPAGGYWGDEPEGAPTITSPLNLLSDEELVTLLKDKLIFTKDESGIGEYYGTFPSTVEEMLESGFKLELSETYYIGETKDRPARKYSADTHPYAVLGSGFTNVELGETGYFKSLNAKYEYVGVGNGAYSVAEGEVADPLNTVIYSSLFVDSGFINNNWFRYGVFDDGTEAFAESFPIVVDSVLPSEVTSELVEAADFILITNGYGTLTSYDTRNDLTAEVIEQLKAKTTTAEIVTPLYVDGGIARGTNIGNFVMEVKRTLGTYTDAVNNSFMVLEEKPLVSPTFQEGFKSGEYQEFYHAFYQVYKEIIDDNFLREVTGAELLPVEVSVATSLRHIINYPHRRMDSQKDSIQVLEVQPIWNGTTTTETISGLGSGKIKSELTEAQVAAWVEGSGLVAAYDGETADDIIITTMPITEFIGKIEDITEEYDMVYIGASNEGFNLLNGHPDYNDNGMDGLYYTNIGDIMTHSKNVAGLLDTDYNTTVGLKTVNAFGSNTGAWGKVEVYPFVNTASNFNARFSGLDLTPSKYEELINFANSGFPIIIEDELVVLEDTSRPAQSVSVQLESASSEDGTVLLSVTEIEAVKDTPYTLKYQWYKDGVMIEGANYDYYRCQEDGMYYCEVTLMEGNQVIQNVNSDIMKVESSGIAAISSEPIRFPENYQESASYGGVRTVDEITWDAVTKTGSYSTTASLNFELPEGAVIKSATWYTGYTSYTEVLRETSKFYQVKVEENLSEGWSTLSGPLVERVVQGYMCVFEVEIDGEVVQFVSDRRGLDFQPDGKAPMGPYYASNPSVDGKVGTKDVDTARYDMSVKTTSVKTESGYELSATPSLVAVGGNKNIPDPKYFDELSYEYQWYEVDGSGAYRAIAGSTSSVLAVDSTEKEYLCVVTIGDYSVYTEFNSNAPLAARGQLSSQKISVVEARAGISLGGGGTLEIPEVPDIEIGINGDRVDNSSYMYQLLDEARWRENVMSADQAESDTDIIVQYLNLSKPEIVFTEGGMPEEYVGDSIEALGRSLIEDSLQFEFEIRNATDPTAHTTTYETKLYIDQNADGKFEESEQIPDLQVYEVTAEGGRGQAVVENQLIANSTYMVERILPNEFYGAIPWKFEVTKTSDGTVHNSQTGITYRKPKNDIEINVLQIAGTDSTGNAPDGLPSVFDNKIIEVSSVYDINIIEKTITDLNQMQTDAEAAAAEGEEVKALLDYIEEYDINMILMGLQESYGRTDSYDGFSRSVSDQINEFIDSGKATLFSHDNVSNENVPAYLYPMDNGYSHQVNSTTYYSSYYLTVLNRGKSGQDPYGVVNDQFGYSKYSYVADANKNGIHYVASGYEGMTQEVEDQIQESGYGIAYDHGTNREATVAQTQAYNGYSLMVHRVNASQKYPTETAYNRDGSFATTGSVSQVNKGAVTSYPYNVNVGEFAVGDSTAQTLDIAKTHHQWYQLNMNTEDIVVWYCLTDDGTHSADTYRHGYNDVINSYYIYNIGNVTYTGAGHNVGTGSYEKTTEVEAELFINTIIAAYRVSVSTPEAEFLDEHGSAITDFYLLTEFNENEAGYEYDEQLILPADGETGTFSGTLIDFQVKDSNLDLNKKVQVALYYETTTMTEGQTYYKLESGDMIEVENPSGDGEYYARISQGDMKLKTASGSEVSGDATLGNETMYEYYLSEGILEQLRENHNLKLYLEATTTIPEEEPLKGLSDPLTLSKLGLQDLN